MAEETISVLNSAIGKLGCSTMILASDSGMGEPVYILTLLLFSKFPKVGARLSEVFLSRKRVNSGIRGGWYIASTYCTGAE
jgi:hypothetical protein